VRHCRTSISSLWCWEEASHENLPLLSKTYRNALLTTPFLCHQSMRPTREVVQKPQPPKLSGVISCFQAEFRYFDVFTLFSRPIYVSCWWDRRGVCKILIRRHDGCISMHYRRSSRRPPTARETMPWINLCSALLWEDITQNFWVCRNLILNFTDWSRVPRPRALLYPPLPENIKQRPSAIWLRFCSEWSWGDIVLLGRSRLWWTRVF
jgi:hypothetical protein